MYLLLLLLVEVVEQIICPLILGDNLPRVDLVVVVLMVLDLDLVVG